MVEVESNLMYVSCMYVSIILSWSYILKNMSMPDDYINIAEIYMGRRLGP
jgi:hypothetical protein